MKKRILPFSKKSYNLFLKTLKRYQNVKQRLTFTSLSTLAKFRLEKKLVLLERRLLSLNAKALTGIATTVLLAWLSNPAQAQFPAVIVLETDSNSLTISGGNAMSAGDVNGDGMHDIIVPDPSGNGYAGVNYVIFGDTLFVGDTLNVSDLNGPNGFVINGIDSGDESGFSVSAAGDVNGDSIADIIIGARHADPNGINDAGESYVVFGNSSFTSPLNLADLDGMNGFVINGVDSLDESGFSVSGTGDLNGDGIDDVIIGARHADPNGIDDAGKSYVMFGRSSFTSPLSLASLNGMNGFVINGIAVGDESGFSVSGAGDVNGDSIADIIIGAPFASNAGGESYVVFGSNSFTSPLSLMGLNGSNGFVVNGISSGDESGISVSGAGDVNRDGFDDVIIGAHRATPYGSSLPFSFNSGQSYVIFGDTNFPSEIEHGRRERGFVINGVREQAAMAGAKVSGAGDINGDGFDDVVMIASSYYSEGQRGYVIFGGSDLISTEIFPTSLDGSNGFLIMNDVRSVSGPGDINRDGVDDVFIGGFVLYGRQTPIPYTPILTSDINTIICTEDSITISIAVDDNLNSASKWVLYADSLTTTPVDSNITGMFTIPVPVASTTYLVRGEGDNDLTGQAGIIDITVGTIIPPSITADDSLLMAAPDNGLTYNWVDCADSTIIAGETGTTFIAPTAGGNYAVIVTNVCGIDTSSCVFVASDSTIIAPEDSIIAPEDSTVTPGVDENSFGSAISLYPNPTSGDVLLELGEVKDAVITLLDVTGKTISVVKSGNRSSIPIPLRDFRQGIYFVTIATNNDKKVMKLVKK